MKEMQKSVQLWAECDIQCMVGASFDFIFIYILFGDRVFGKISSYL